MKVLLINGSPHKEGCTYTALKEVADTLEARRLTRMEKHLRVLLSVSSKPKKQNLQRILHL